MPTKYKVDDGLSEIVKEVLESGQFPDTEGFRIKAVFAKGSAPRTRKLPAAAKFPPYSDSSATTILFWCSGPTTGTLKQTKNDSRQSATSSGMSQPTTRTNPN